MFALILSNIALDDLLDDNVFNTLKEVEDEVKGICIVLDRESEDDLYDLETKLEELNMKSSIINIKRPAKEKLKIKNGVRLLPKRKEYKFIFYANNLAQIKNFVAFKEEFLQLTSSESITSKQVFSDRYVYYGNIYRLEDLLVQQTA